MSKSSKPIACVCGSRTIDYLNLDFYLDSQQYSQIICGGANGVDTIAELWAKRHGIECIIYRPQYKAFGRKYAPLKRDEDMVNASDIIIAFWDGKSKGTKYTIDYARKNGVPVQINLIDER